MAKTTIDPAALEGVSATTLWTLRNRAEESLHPASEFDDPWAERLYREIHYDYGKFGAAMQQHALRAQTLDGCLREFVAEHPDGTVVCLGEGLQTTYWRLGRPDVDWISLDLEPVLDLRRRLLPEEPRVTLLPMSALDAAWLDHVDAGRPVFVAAEGLFMYFTREQVLTLIDACATRFPGGRMFFDSIPTAALRVAAGGMRMSDRYTAPPMPFGCNVSQAERLPRIVPGVSGVRDLMCPPGRGVFGSRLLRALLGRRPFRDLKRAQTLLTF